MSILVLGTVALDSVKTPYGERQEILGGSAAHFSMAARIFTKVYLVSIIGLDFPPKFIKFLADKGVMTKVYFDPVHLTYFYKHKLKYECDLPVTEEISQKVISLPMYPNIKERDMDFIVHKIKEFYG